METPLTVSDMRFLAHAHVAMIQDAFLAMSETDLADLESWERANLDGQTGTIDWPGWTERFGIVRPTFPRKSQPIKKRVLSVMLRAAIMARDGACCVLCGTTARPSIDHIFPKSRGGSDEPENLRVLCRPCNSRKGARV